MRIKVSHADREDNFDRDLTEVVVGRPVKGFNIDLDLTPDAKVSRPHARILHQFGRYWIEDLHSARGTQINGTEIKGKGRQRLRANDVITIGETSLWVEVPPEEPSESALLDSELEAGIGDYLDAGKPALSSSAAVTDADRRLALFYEIPLAFARAIQLDKLFQMIVERAIEVIPVGRRSALLIKDRQTGEWLRVASIPTYNPSASTTLAEKAMASQEGFIWTRPSEEDATPNNLPGSASKHGIQSALYAPLLWEGEVLGVICVDNQEITEAFEIDDLRLLQALAHFAASAVSHIEKEKQRSEQIKILDNLRKLISPQLAKRLSQYTGRIRLGGEFREATILFSDIRGFTKLARSMDVEDVAELIEDYFSRLVPIVFKHGGMIDKFVGDAILAVFGSPDADEHQHRHAVKQRWQCKQRWMKSMVPVASEAR